MRNNQQMMDLILNYARQDERIRAVAMNGSRVNINAPADLFQDYDIVYMVNDVASFTQDHSWIDYFGERLILQMPDASVSYPPHDNGSFAYLMLFTDGNRIDLRLLPVAQYPAYLLEDKLTVILMDKDRILPELPQPTDEDYRVTRPTAAEFAHCCNEFWWVSTYIAKGLWRREILYALSPLNLYVRPMLIRMLSWQAGIEHDFRISIGKSAKYLERYLPADDWQALLATYPRADYKEIWQSVWEMTELFSRIAPQVASRLGLEYNREEEQNVTTYLHHIAALPYDAASIYPD
ncbi:aminoglycoside 6-adenylyltransferase [Paenibacillus bovis]|uniref:Aminoglycoside adenylyltransferase n=1 Tax=Paenibacillus bovis TaxID=1616788 RepID=A0A172ZDK2_9BACL|nr:aminoglycoside 6-adenylyltransferase [Paenibacillus bovis]ANF95688.1 aminoglycoside adenylyltransferase [Paenibacillus bovis]